jgi:hypothetical protein
MRLACVTLAVVILAALSIQASAQKSDWKIAIGQWGSSCGKWTQERQSRSAGAHLSAQWVAAYLSGKNFESTFLDEQDDPLRGAPDFDGLMAWIDNYCGSHPLETVHKAADQLMDELRARVQRRR